MKRKSPIKAFEGKNLKILLLVLVLSAVFVAFRVAGLHGYLDEGRLRDWISGFKDWGPVVYILIFSVAPSLMLPGLPITVIGGVLFGPFWGSVYTVIGATIGATIAFLIARAMGRGWVEGFISGRRGKPGKIEELDALVKAQGWKVVALTRLIPLFPYNFLNYAFGLTDIKIAHYVIATFIFMIPGTVAYVVFSSSIFDLLKGNVSVRLVIGAALLLIVSLIPVIYKRYKNPNTR
ncbi:MAG: TVP38/TMEM64 family protein [Deltaproteobacteria bacterium]|nr:TVP38/TMEM64 family protein [Deltaproteobacteria bacterium]